MPDRLKAETQHWPRRANVKPPAGLVVRDLDRPDGYEPSDARSIRTRDAVAVTDMAMQRTVTPSYVGSKSSLRSALSARPLDEQRPTSHRGLKMKKTAMNQPSHGKL